MALDATPGGAAANSYVTVAEADAYMAARLHKAAWETANSATKEAALQWATRELDRLAWRGRAVTEIQALRWPRSYIYDLDGYRLLDGAIPRFLKDATAELAFSLIASDRTADAQGKGLASVTVGPIEIEFDKQDTAGVIPRAVTRMIMPYIEAPVRWVARA